MPAILLLGFSGNKTKSGEPEQETDSIAVHEDDSNNDEEENDPYKPRVFVSEDGIVTIESAICPESGTAPDYWTRWKFKNKAGKDCEVYFDLSASLSNIHSIKKDDGSTYYIVSCFRKASSADGYEWLEAYKIIGDTIKEVSVIDGRSNPDKDKGHFSINYCIPNYYFMAGNIGYQWIFEYDTKTRNLYVPIIVGESCFELRSTDKYNVWHFNGKRFVGLGVQPHKDMHKILAKYNRLIQYFETKDYIVRVDSLDSHELRYASWHKPKTMSAKPDIVINGGYRTTYHVEPDQLRPCDDYRFKIDDYEYIVNYCETKWVESGFGEHHDFLVVKKDGQIILKQEQKEGE